ncbi:MAG TPA: TIGR03086 family metal-binding protein [Chloroflexota bacterium]|nr:TIGR03086 family metal-binding protein [Chloroflexota bacterium]
MTQGNPVQDLERTLDSVERLIGGVRPEQWSNPTPCTDWDVRQLVSHMASGNLRFAAIVSGGPVTPEASDDPAKALRAAGAALLDSFTQPGALERSYQSPFGELPGPALVHLRIGEMLTHGWDLARATGQMPDLPEDLAEQELAAFRAQLGNAPRESSPVGQPQPVADDAPAIDRLAAFLGRSVMADAGARA